MTARRWIGLAIALVLIVTGLWVALGHPMQTHDVYTPTGVIHARLVSTMTKREYCHRHPKGCITRTRHEFFHKPLTIVPERGAESCSGMDGKAVGENGIISDIVHGSAQLRACTRDGVHLSDAGLSKDHHESWLWSFDDYNVLDNRTFWCAECMSEAHVWTIQYRWHRGISVFGQELFWHYTNTVHCTYYVLKGPHPSSWNCG